MDFISYYNQHYKPMLDRLTDFDETELRESDRRLLSFLKEDIEKWIEENS